MVALSDLPFTRAALQLVNKLIAGPGAVAVTAREQQVSPSCHKTLNITPSRPIARVESGVQFHLLWRVDQCAKLWTGEIINPGPQKSFLHSL
jgi:hypothetical protein